jgi:Flp pilus assembly protein TadG
MMCIRSAVSRKFRKSARPLAPLLYDQRGATMVEMAMTLPVLLAFLFGILSGGSWLAMAHAVQQGANDAARSAIAGLTPAERATLAADTARTVLARTYGVAAADVATTVQDDGQRLTVTVSYNGTRNPLLSLPIMPAASKVIERRGSVMLTGL